MPCKSRFVLLKEKEERAARMIAGEKIDSGKEPLKEKYSMLPGCTIEGVVYAIHYQTCRKEGLVREYIGELSCSPSQRGQEHMREIEGGVLAHPMVQHFWECYKVS